MRRSIDKMRKGMFRYMMKNNSKNNLIGVEIGINFGEHSRAILSNLPIKKLYLIDPYTYYKDFNFAGYDHESPDKRLSIAKKNLRKYKDKTIFIRKFSHNAINDVPNNLDFVYIDGNHNYNYVLRDIELYYPKVYINGLIGGHDFCGSWLSVIEAVQYFAKKNNLKIYGMDKDWWFIKK